MSRLLRRWTAAAILQGMVWLVLLALALALPAIRFSLERTFERGTMASEAQARAFIVGQRVAANPLMWAYETPRLSDHIEHRLLSSGQMDRRAVLDAQGQVIVETRPRGQLPWPVIAHREPLYDHGRVAGWVELERTLRGTLEAMVVLGLVCITLAGALALLLTRLPLRRLRDVEDELAHKAFHDNLTGLYNREAFRRLLAECVLLASRDGRPLAVMFIDLDRFKSINDTLGHDAGDQALRAVADRLRSGIRHTDTVARLSGDEFAMLIQDPQIDAQQLADKLLQRFDAPFVISGRHWRLGCSIGVALFPQHALDADRLLACADTAMLNAKASGRSATRVYHGQMEADVLRRLQMEDDLRGALDRGEFLLHYQPLVELDGGALVGVEALLRWTHPTRGAVPPVEFIPVLEDAGMIHAVGQWVLQQACLQMRRWLDEGLPMRRVAVNVSPLQFARGGDFVAAVRDALDQAGLPGKHLELEVTEGTLMADSEHSLLTLGALRELGAQLAIDDFGTGYSSLAYLRSFPVSVLKVDRSFVRDMDVSERNASIVKAVVQMAHSLGLSVTAEGIETEQQRLALRQLGCDTGQGHYLGRPMPAQALRELQGLAASESLPDAVSWSSPKATSAA